MVDAQELIASTLGGFKVEIRASVRSPQPEVVSDRDTLLLRLEKTSAEEPGAVPLPEEVCLGSLRP